MTKPTATLFAIPAMLAVAAAPVAAQAQSAERAAARVERSEGLGRFATPVLLFLAGAAVVAAIILLDKEDDEVPVSP